MKRRGSVVDGITDVSIAYVILIIIFIIFVVFASNYIRMM